MTQAYWPYLRCESLLFKTSVRSEAASADNADKIDEITKRITIKPNIRKSLQVPVPVKISRVKTLDLHI